MTNSAPILVVGGGIGGLTAALGIGRKGWPVKVLEETPEFGAIGYGIQLLIHESIGALSILVPKDTPLQLQSVTYALTARTVRPSAARYGPPLSPKHAV